MNSAKLSQYLSRIPLFRCLPLNIRNAVAQRLASRQLRGGERLDLRGGYANVLCIVTRGKVRVEAHLRSKRILRSQVVAGQWIGQAWILGWSQATRTCLTAYGRGATILLLWQQDVAAIPAFKWLITLCNLLSRPVKVLEHPTRTGVVIPLSFFVFFLLFTQPGKSLLADWTYVRMARQVTLSQERRFHLLSRVLRLAPDHPLGAVNLGNMLAESGDVEVAMLNYTRVADRNSAATNNLGVLLLRQGNPEEALKILTLGTQLEPDAAVMYQNLGIASQQAGRQEEAISAFKEALRIDPSLTVARYHLGLHYLSQQDLVKASAAFERVLEQDPTCAPALTALGLVYLVVGDLERAVHVYRQATQLEPNSVVAQFHLGCTEARMGNEAESKAALARVLELRPPEDLRERVTIMLSGEATLGP